MATDSSVLAWRIPGTGDPGGLPSMGSHRVGHDWSDLAAAARAYFVHYYIFHIVFEAFALKSLRSDQMSRSFVFDSLQPHESQHARPPCTSPTPGVHSDSRPSSQWCHPAISSLCLLPSIFSASGSFPVSSSHQVPKVLELQLQHQSFQRIFRTDFTWDWLVGSSCSPRDSQESSPKPQIKSINSSVLSFLCGPTLTSIHDYRKNHSFD